MKFVLKIGLVLVFFGVHCGLFARNAFCSDFKTKAVASNLLLPSATISGTTTVCQNAAGPVITFTGSGGTAPYTFTYNINGGAALTVSTTGTNLFVTVSVNTSNAGNFNYNLTSVQDSATPPVSQVVSGTAVITIKPQPNAPKKITVTVFDTKTRTFHDLCR